MPRFTVTQPDGLFAIWSSVCDNFIIWNATKEQIIEYKLQEAKEEFERDFDMYLDKYEKFSDCVKTTIYVHGKKGIPKTLNITKKSSKKT